MKPSTPGRRSSVRSRSCGRRGITRSATEPWVSASSTTARSRRWLHCDSLASSACSSWIGTCTTATASRRCAARLAASPLHASSSCACWEGTSARSGALAGPPRAVPVATQARRPPAPRLLFGCREEHREAPLPCPRTTSQVQRRGPGLQGLVLPWDRSSGGLRRRRWVRVQR